MIKYSTVSVASTFPPENRPTYIYPLAEMTFKNKEAAWPIIARGIEEIISRNPTQRVLIHTVSYDLTSYLLSKLSMTKDITQRLVAYTQSSQRQRALDIYLAQEASVLLAPSLDRGIDLSGDDCRAIVVCKIPYPNLGDKQISARMHSRNGQLWYSVQAVRSLVQMTGRGMRHKDDYCESYILDRMFVSKVWKSNRSLIPKWWSDALIWDAGRLF